jgi:lincosamide nucleotidyltransferase A/C/D/E
MARAGVSTISTIAGSPTARQSINGWWWNRIRASIARCGWRTSPRSCLVCRRRITVWLDGGWCVDALVGRQTRPHADLDIAVARADEDRLRAWLRAGGYVEVGRPGATPANFVLGDVSGRQVDVHVFEFAEDGRLRYGITYPKESLTGHAELNGLPVRCVAAEWMFRFKTAYPPAPKDVADVRALHEKFGFPVPPGHRS